MISRNSRPKYERILKVYVFSSSGVLCVRHLLSKLISMEIDIHETHPKCERILSLSVFIIKWRIICTRLVQ